MVTFNHPEFMVTALSLVLGFLLVSLIVIRIQRGAIDRFGRRETLSRFSQFTRKTTTVFLLALAMMSLSIAAAEPVLNSVGNVSALTLNAVIVMDVSRSMLAKDGLEGKTRLESGVLAIEQVLDSYPDARIGLILYSGVAQAYLPTFDHEAIRFILHYVMDSYQHVQGEGSNTMDALEKAGTLIEALPYRIDTIFLISDGGTSLTPSAFAPQTVSIMEKLRKLGVRIVAVGIGDYLPSPIPVYDQNGAFVGYHQYQGMTAYTSLDETPLLQFADETSGWYIHLTDFGDLVKISRDQHLDSQPTVQATTVNLVWLPVAISLLFVSILLLMRTVRPRIS